MKNHKDLKAWKEAVELSVACYEVTKKSPQGEQFALASQMWRAAISVASNIAEGVGHSFHSRCQYLCPTVVVNSAFAFNNIMKPQLIKAD